MPSWLYQLVSAHRFNISMNLVSYLTYYLFPFVTYGGVNPNLTTLATLNTLEGEYFKVVNTTFGGNTMSLLNNITFNCAQLIDFCMFGFNKIYSSMDCCDRFFRPAEFSFTYMCFRSNEKMAYSIREAGILSGVLIG